VLGHLTPLEAVELATRGMAYTVGHGAWEWPGPALKGGGDRRADYWESDEPDMDGLAAIIAGGR
jgi:hypothetical protein